MNRRQFAQGAAAVATALAVRAASAAEPERWAVYRLNDCEWYMARSLEEAIAAASENWGALHPLSIEEGEEDGLIDLPEELTDEELDVLQFADFDEDGVLDRSSVRTFREELAQRVANDPTPQLFACTEW